MISAIEIVVRVGPSGNPTSRFGVFCGAKQSCIHGLTVNFLSLISRHLIKIGHIHEFLHRVVNKQKVARMVPVRVLLRLIRIPINACRVCTRRSGQSFNLARGVRSVQSVHTHDLFAAVRVEDWNSRGEVAELLLMVLHFWLVNVPQVAGPAKTVSKFVVNFVQETRVQPL